MSSSDAQPPVTRRQARERERAAATGAMPVVPPPTTEPASASEQSRRRPGSHAAPMMPAPRQTAVQPPVETPAQPPMVEPAPASATEIVPGTGMTRRQMRALRAAQEQGAPVPLQTPSPQSSDRTVADVLDTVAVVEGRQHPATDATAAATPAPAARIAPAPAAAAPAAPEVVEPEVVEPDVVEPEAVEPAAAEPVDAPAEPVIDEAAERQATEADGSPDAIEPLEAAAEHGEEPRRRRSTWAPHNADDDAAEPPLEPASDEAPEIAQPVPEEQVAPALKLPLPSSLPSPREPGVFPLDLDAETTEVPAAVAEPAPAESAPVEPKPMTTAFEAPTGHWSRQGEGVDDDIHESETGIRRVTDTSTSALVLPSAALGDVTGALNATGEVILTGSIDLPKSLSSTGSHRPIDGAEVDRLLDQHDETPETDASPVRASKAVSSHTSTRQVVLAAAKPKQSRTPVVVAGIGAGVGVVAIGAIVFAVFGSHIFG